MKGRRRARPHRAVAITNNTARELRSRIQASHRGRVKREVRIADQREYNDESREECAAFYQQQPEPINRHIIHGGSLL